MNICVFCSSNELSDKYNKPARELARSLAKSGHNLVYGGSDHGLMRVVADAMRAEGSKLLGVTIPIYSAHVRKDLDEMVKAKNLGERKKIMLERADAILVLPGGIGTLDELTEILELKRQTYHDKLIIVLNTDGFYDGFQVQLKQIASENMFKAGENSHIPIKSLDDFLIFVDKPGQVINLLPDHVTF